MKQYKYELHAHTSEVSSCSILQAKELVSLYAAHGYDGLLITDHMYRGYCQRYENWDACVNDFWFGFQTAKKHGDSLGITVVPGMEITFEESGNDYLIIGLDEAMLRNMPHPYTLGLEKFYKQYGDQVLIVQAHPYRGGKENNIRPQFLHGVEGINCNPRHNNHNEKAMQLFYQNPHLLCTCGSDTHEHEDVGQATVLFPERLDTSAALRAVLLSGNYRLEFGEYSGLVPTVPGCQKERTTQYEKNHVRHSRNRAALAGH